MKFMVFYLKFDERKVESEEFEKEGVYGIIDYGFEFYERFGIYLIELYDLKNVVVMGMGLFLGLILFGVYRFMFFFCLLFYGMFFLLVMGGVVYVFKNVGVDFVIFEGKVEKLVVVIFYNDGLNINVEFYEIEFEKLIEIWKDYKGEEGVYVFI